MGTRGALGFRVGGKDKITYNHFDSYPEGLGVAMAGFIAAKPSVEGARVMVARLKDVSGTEPSEAYRVLYEDSQEDVSTGQDWYSLLRGNQGDPEAILVSGVYEESGSSWLCDSLFCEWAYILNFDEEVLEVYVGFQTEPHEKGRYAPLREGSVVIPEHYPVALVGSYPFADFQSEDFDLKGWLEAVQEQGSALEGG
jgi:hypothetical protein